MANMNIRMDDSVKKQAEQLFLEMGINMTTAINIFLRQAVRENGLPFKVGLNVPNAVTISALEEGDRIAYDETVKGYKDIASLRKALEV